MNNILIVGDFFPVQSNLSFFADGNVGELFDNEIIQLFTNTDYRACNLEGALTDSSIRMEKTGPVIVAPTKVVNAYKALGIDYCLLANNHITDARDQGVVDTMTTLENAGIQYVGAGKDESAIPHHFFISVGGKKICIYNVCETMYNKPSSIHAGAWLYDEYVVCKELESLKKQCDFIVVVYHGGIEKFRYPSPETKKRFHRMADSGADVILSQHTHCIGCEEYYNGSYLLYGQGDFLFNNFRPKLTDTGIIVELSFKEGQMQIKKHFVKCTDNYCLQYVKNYDFSEFEERSSHVNDDAFLDAQFQQFCMKELRLYLTAFKSPGLVLRALRKVFPKRFNKWLRSKAYRRKDLMFALHTLRSEQNRETAIVGMEKLLEIDT
ncbi:MAG: CapA family protein [Prevotella sp.]|jgi:poly-gamma-glutamate synthesis protein (capsule biosynthesis protein)|nr:CapA family protein [Prevotella sp.]